MAVYNNNTISTVTIEDELEVIDLDSYHRDPEKQVVEWDEQIRSRILEDLVDGNEQQLEKFLQQYKKSLKEEASLFSDIHLVKKQFLNHIRLIYFCCSHLLFKKSHWTPYLEQYEDLLAEYCTLELSVVQHLRRKHSKNSYEKCEEIFLDQCSSVYRHLCNLLSVCLQNSEKHIMHVLLKLRFNTKSPACREIMHGMFSYYMIELPQKDYSVEAFCRYYLALKRWQQIQRPDSHAVMEKIMYLRMNRPADCIENDEKIRTILGIRCCDPVAIFSLITESIDTWKGAYFNYIRENKGVSEYESDCSLHISSDDECVVRNRASEPVVISDDDDEASDDDIEIVQVTGPAPISLSDDEGGGIGPPNKSISHPEKNRSEPVLTTGKRQIEEVAKEQRALVIEQDEEEVLHYQLVDNSEKCDNSEKVHRKETNAKDVSGVEEVTPVEDVVIESEETIFHRHDETSEETSVKVIASVQEVAVENEDEILEAFSEITIDKNAIEENKNEQVRNANEAQIFQSEEVQFNEVVTQKPAAEENRKEPTNNVFEDVVNASEAQIFQSEEVHFNEVVTQEAAVEENRKESASKAVEEVVNTNEAQIIFNETAPQQVIIEENRKEQTSSVVEEVASANEAQIEIEKVATEEDKTSIPLIQVVNKSEAETFKPEEVHFNESVTVFEENKEEFVDSPREKAVTHFVSTEESVCIPLKENVTVSEEKSVAIEKVQEVEELQKNVDVTVETVHFEAPHVDTIEETATEQELLPENVADNVILISLPNIETEDPFETFVIELPSYVAPDAVADGTAVAVAPQCGVIDENLQPPQEEIEEAQVKPTTPSSFSISRLIGNDDEKTKEKIGMPTIVPFDINDPNLHNIICVDIEATQSEDATERVCRLVNVVEKDGVPHILDDGVLTRFQDIPVTDANETAVIEEQPPQLQQQQPLPPPQQQQQQEEENVVPEKLGPPVLTKQEPQKTCTNGTKLKPAIKQTTPANGLTGRISYTSKETLNIPLTQHFDFKEEEILNGENYFSGPVNGVVEYQDNSSKSHNGILMKENKRKGDVDRTRQKRARFTKEEDKCYEYASESVYAPREKPPPVRVHAVSFAAYGVKLTDAKLREKNKKTKVVVPKMPRAEMEAIVKKRRDQIERKKRECTERAASRLKEAQCKPLEVPKEKPTHVSLIQGRFDYKTPQQELQSRLVIPHTSHETSTPSLWSETTYQDKQKGNRSGGVKKTSIATRRRTKVNGENVNNKPSMDVLFDSLKNGIDSSLKSKKGDKT